MTFNAQPYINDLILTLAAFTAFVVVAAVVGTVQWKKWRRK